MTKRRLSGTGLQQIAGFSVVEMLVAVFLMLSLAAVIVSVLKGAQASFTAEPERADMQQRLRVAADALYQDLLMAGNGAYTGTLTGSFTYFFSPVLPYRQGLRQSDPPGSSKADTVTLLYVPQTNAQALISQPIPAESGSVDVRAEPGCALGDPGCGFASGMNVLVYDTLGFYDLFTVTGVAPPTLQLQHDLRGTAHWYAAGSKIVQVVSRTYYLKSDDVNGAYQLMRYEGGSGNDVPVVDHVVGVQFEYYGDSQPPTIRKPLSEPKGPWTSYGPRPPDIGVRATDYPAGENCIFTIDGSGSQVPRLGPLGAAEALVRLPSSVLTDGPWCPDGSNPNRFDADLLRVRKIAVTLRVQSAVDALRGPAGVLFKHAGLAKAADRLVPDRDIRFEVSPRNLNLGR